MSKLLMEYDIDRENNALHLIGEVDEEMFRKVTQAFIILDTKETINILLSTYGGELYYGLGIYDYLLWWKDKCGAKIQITCVGPVMSAGTIILQAASERVALPHAQIMVHYGYDQNSSASDLKQNADLLDLMKKIYLTRVSCTKRTINKWFITDTYLSAKHSLKVGMIDRIA